MDGDIDTTTAYRRALSCYATGVAIITADAAEGAWAITVNSFVSISLSPRLVMWSLGNEADRYPAFAGAPAWGVNILAAGQEAISARFAAHGAPQVAEHELERWGAGAPLFRDALARLDCRTVARHHIGDHLLIVGEVGAFDSRDGDGLTYFRSRYGRAVTPGS
jgi:flavin reductase (DIM6/NTAB) family NADH-FMN oxidoreductase RutF